MSILDKFSLKDRVALVTAGAGPDLPPRLIPLSMLEFRGTQPWLPAGA